MQNNHNTPPVQQMLETDQPINLLDPVELTYDTGSLTSQISTSMPESRASAPLPPPRRRRRRKPGNRWISFMKGLSWFVFVLLILGGAGYGFFYAYEMYMDFSMIESILSIVIFSLAGILTSLLWLAGCNVWLNIALDVSAARIALEDLDR